MPTPQVVKVKKQQGQFTQELEPITPTADRGVKFWPELYELRKTTAPTVLVQIAFYDNEDDAKWVKANIEKSVLLLQKEDSSILALILFLKHTNWNRRSRFKGKRNYVRSRLLAWKMQAGNLYMKK